MAHTRNPNHNSNGIKNYEYGNTNSVVLVT